MKNISIKGLSCRIMEGFFIIYPIS